MFSYYLTKIGVPWVSISVVDLEIAIKGSVCYNFFRVRIRRTDKGVLPDVVYPNENRRRSSLRMVRIRRTDEGVLSDGLCLIYFLLSRRSLLSRSTRAFPKGRRRSPLDVVACLYRLDSACFCR